MGCAMHQLVYALELRDPVCYVELSWVGPEARAWAYDCGLTILGILDWSWWYQWRDMLRESHRRHHQDHTDHAQDWWTFGVELLDGNLVRVWCLSPEQPATGPDTYPLGDQR